MPTAQHTIVKPQVIVDTAVGVLEQELVLPKLFTPAGIDQFKGTANDTITLRVPGRLPARNYAWRNDRTNPIVLDTYSESTTTLTFGGNLYQGVEIIDEQVDMDLANPDSLVPVQARAIASQLNKNCVDAVLNQQVPATIGNCELNPKRALIEARKTLNKFKLPASQTRYLLVGSDFEAMLLDDDKLNLASAVGETEAVNALRDATIGRRYGFTIITVPELPATEAYAMTSDAFVLRTAVPSVPVSAPFGATTNFEGFALRWIKDYDTLYFRDRSVLNTYWGTAAIKDRFEYWDGGATPAQEKISVNDHFVRAIKLKIAGESAFHLSGSAGTEFTAITGVQKSTLWDGDGNLAD